VDYFLFGVLSALLVYLNYLIYVLRVELKEVKDLANDLMVTLNRISRGNY